jgi:ABC-2 type transport system permease protein
MRVESLTPLSPANGPPVPAATTRDLPVYDSSRPRLPIVQDAIELFRYRDLLWSLIQRDLTVRYKRSVLGFFWTMLNPLLTMLVMAVVFSSVFRFDAEHYAVYLLSGLLWWNFFSQSTVQAIGNLVWGGDLINRIYVPKSVFVVSAIGVGLMNWIFALVPLALIMLVTGQAFSIALLCLPVSILFTVLFATGVGLLVATLAVFFSDIVNVYQVGLTILMYLTPIVYPVAVVPTQYQVFLRLNPLYYFLEIFRQPIYDGRFPDSWVWATGAVLALGMLIVGWWIFTAKADEFAYRV